jgi:MarR family transcriptional regulator, organic hydroperoxide resistance regulator
MPRRPTTKAALAAEVWRDIFNLIIATASQRNRSLARLGLTPNDSRALHSLDQETGRTLRALADEWQCDASTATWIVDRLETKGLAERRAHPSDRRARHVFLTPLGVQKRAEMVAETYTPPSELLTLDRTDLITLRDALARLPTSGRPVFVPGAQSRSEQAGG